MGGVPVLFLNVAKELSKRGYLTSVVDFNDGYMAKNKGSETGLIAFEANLSVSIPENSILIFQSDLPWGLPKNLICSPTTKVFFWNCYPFNLVPNLPKPLGDFLASRVLILKILLATLMITARTKTKRFTELLITKNALCFMDFPNWSLTQKMLQIKNLPEVFLPVLVNQVPRLKPQSILQKNLKLAWVGRLADFKIYPLLRILEDLNELEQPISFVIIGSGQYQSFLKEKTKSFSYLQIEFIDHIDYQNLHPYLNSNIDLLFAMGTSALDGGLSCVPTVLMNFSYKEISSDYRYHFLNQTEKFSLGDLIDKNNLGKGLAMNQIVQAVHENKEKIASECQNYVANHHLLENKINTFLQLTSNSNLTYTELIQTDLEKPGFYKIWTLIKKLF